MHGGDITVGGERSAVELLIKMVSKRYEIRKQVIGEDPDLEKIGRILNRVIAWTRDGMTIEADQRDVREKLKGLEWERANHSATTSAMERKDEGKGEHRRRQGQTRTEHERDDMDNGDNRDRLQVAGDDDNDSPALAGGNITWHRALTARISYLSQDRPDLKVASMEVCCAMARPTMRDMERVKRIGRYLVGRPRERCWFRWQRSGELEAYSDADWGGDKATLRSVSAGVIMTDTASKYGPRSSKSYRCPPAESELYAAVKTASEGAREPERGRGLGFFVWTVNPHLDASATMCLVKCRGLGKAKHVDMQNLWIQEASKAGRFVTKKVGMNVNPADLITKPLAKPKIE